MTIDFSTLGLRGAILAIVDVAIVSYVFYRFLLLIRGTRAVQLLKGIVVVFLATAASNWLHLQATYWLLERVQWALLVALPIVFQPELRRALEQVGRARFFAGSLMTMEEGALKELLAQVVRAAVLLARRKIGAIIVLERVTRLGDIVETGIAIDGMVSAELLVNVFIPNTPLHDGAVIIRGNRVLAAACFLPLAESQDLGVEFGSRHRAAIGIGEHSDAVALVVSEETGQISLAHGGKLIRNLDEKTLMEMLENLIPSRDRSPLNFWQRGNQHG